MDATEPAKSAAVTALEKRLHAQQPGEQHWLPAAQQHSSPHTSACAGQSFQQLQGHMGVWGAHNDPPALTPAYGAHFAVCAGPVFSPAAPSSAQLQNIFAGHTAATIPWTHEAPAYNAMTSAAYDMHSQASLADMAEMPFLELPLVTKGLEDLTAPLPAGFVGKPGQQLATGHDASTADGHLAFEAGDSLTLQAAQVIPSPEPAVGAGGSSNAGASSTSASTAQHSMPPNAALAPAQHPADKEQAKIDCMLEALLPQLLDNQSLRDRAAHVIRTLRLEACLAGHSSTGFLHAVVEEVGRMMEAPSRKRDGWILLERLQQLPEYQALVSQAPPFTHYLVTTQHTGTMSYAVNNMQHGQSAGHLFGDALLQAGSFAGTDMYTYAAWTAGLAMTAARSNGFGQRTAGLWDGADAIAAKKNMDDSRPMPPPPSRTPSSRRKAAQPQLSPASMSNIQPVAGSASPGSKAGPAAKGMPTRKRTAQYQDEGLQKAKKKKTIPAAGLFGNAKGGLTCLDLSGAAEGLRQPGMPQSMTHTTRLPQAAGAGSAGVADHGVQGHTATPAGVSAALQVNLPVMAAGCVSVWTDEAQDLQQQLPPHFLSHQGPIMFL